MDQKTAEKVKKKILNIAAEEEIDLESVIMFGSRAREDYNDSSDVDLVLVSKDFENVNWYKRSKSFQLKWDYDELPTPEILCYTPKEFNKRKQRTADIAKKAAEEGIELA